MAFAILPAAGINPLGSPSGDREEFHMKMCILYHGGGAAVKRAEHT
jgi:hypothetical protein